MALYFMQRSMTVARRSAFAPQSLMLHFSVFSHSKYYGHPRGESYEVILQV